LQFWSKLTLNFDISSIKPLIALIKIIQSLIKSINLSILLIVLAKLTSNFIISSLSALKLSICVVLTQFSNYFFIHFFLFFILLLLLLLLFWKFKIRSWQLPSIYNIYDAKLLKIFVSFLTLYSKFLKKKKHRKELLLLSKILKTS
jgi:hypothetical protein